MASQGGGKIKSKGEHSPVKPYEQRKSFFQRVTDSIKDVLRPSWLSPERNNAAVHPTRTSGQSATAAVFQEEDPVPLQNEEPSSETLVVPNNVISEAPSFQHPDNSVTSGSTHNLQYLSSAGNCSGLWSVTSADTSGFDHQASSPVSYNGPGQMVAGGISLSSSSGRIGAASHLHRASQIRTPDATRSLFHPSDTRRSVTSPALGQFGRSPAQHSFTTYRPHVSQSPAGSMSMGRQKQLRQPTSLSSHSFSERASSESASAVSPTKRQRVWTPEVSRKGRSLQPAVRGQPAFSMSAFCSPSLNSPPVRKSVTPKPVNRSNSAVLSSSTTQIYKTLERMSDTKRTRSNWQDNESLLSLTPSSYRRSRPLLRGFQSYSNETRSPAQSPVLLSRSRDAVSTPPPPPPAPAPPASAPAPPAAAAVPQASSSTAPPQKAQDEVVIAHHDDSSNEEDDDDVQIIEAPEEATRKDNGPVSVHNASWCEKSQQQSGRQNDKGSLFNMPGKATQATLGLSKAGSPVTGGFGAASSPVFATPPSWGSTAPKPKSITAPKPKSIMAGNSTPGAISHKSVSFNDSPSEQSGGPVTPLQSGSVMEALGKSPQTLKATGQLKQSNTASPSTTSVSSGGGDNLFAKFTAPSGSWECEMCMVNNKPDVARCVACQASRPGAAQKAASTSPVSSGGGDNLFAKFTAPSGSWECEVCMVNNKPDVARCVACQTSRPGAGASQAAPSPAAVVNTSSVSAAVGPSGGLVFTLPPSSTVSSPFLAPPSSAVKGSSGVLQLGSVNTFMPSVPASGGFKPTTGAGGFKFGASPSSSSPSPAAVSAVSSSGSAGFTFGKPSPGSSSTIPAATGFQFGASSSSSPAFPGTAGVRLGTAASETVSSSDSAGFTFGKPGTGSYSSTSPAASGFQFGTRGSSDSQSTKATEGSGFQFGVKGSSDSQSTKATEGSGFQLVAKGLSDSQSTKATEGSGFHFGVKGLSDSHSTKATEGSGFQLVAKGSNDSQSTKATEGSGFQFGAKDSSDFHSTKATEGSGFQFGAKGSSDSRSTKDTAGSGFQFGASSAAICASSESTSSASLFSSPSFTTSSTCGSGGGTVLGFTGKAVSEVPPAQCERTNLNAQKDASKLTAPEASHTDSRETKPCKRACPLLSVDKTCDGVSASVATSSPAEGASSVTTGGFHCSASPGVLGSIVTPQVTLQGSDSCAKKNTDLKVSSSGGFSFGGANLKTSSSNVGFSFGGVDQKKSSNSGLSFGGADQKTSPLNSGLSFGGADQKTSPSNSGLSFGGADQKTSPSNSGLSFGGADQKTSPSNSGLSFGGADQKTSPSNSGLSFGGADQKTSPSNSGLSFGGADQKTSPSNSGFSFGGADQKTSPLNSGLSFGGADQKTSPSNSGLSFGGADQKTSPSNSGLSFGGADQKTSSLNSGFSFGGTDQKKSRSNSGFSLGEADQKTSPLNSGFSFGGTDQKKSRSNSGFSLGEADQKTSPSNGGFSFGGTDQKKSVSNSGFSFGGADQKKSSNSGFSFGGAARSEQSSSLAAPSNRNGPNLFASSSASSKGFVFGAPSTVPSLLNSSSISSGTAAKSDNTGSRIAQSAKSAVNREAGDVERCALDGGESVTGSSSESNVPGFSFGSPLSVPSKKATSGQNLFAAQAKRPSLFGAEAGSEGTSCEVILLDDEPEEKEPEASFGGSQASSGFGFGAQTTAASSKEQRSSQSSALLSGAEAGTGSTSTGQFFSVGGGAQSNAAAASPPLLSEESAPVKGFSFSGATQPSFSFGSGSSSNSNNSAPAFQFVSPQSVDTAPAHSPSGSLSFEQSAASAKSSDTAHAFAAPTPVGGFSSGPAPHNTFSIGTGETPRKPKRAVRRIPRN